MEITMNTRIGDIVKENFRTARVFEKNRIDFCCGGGISLEEACLKSNVDIDAIMPEIESVIVTSDPDSRYMDSLDLDELCDYIEKRHHTFVRENLPFLQQKLDKLCNVHGDNHPELLQVRDLFNQAVGNLSAHMQKEELILFPYIRKMVQFKKGGLDIAGESGRTGPIIEVMEDEHQAEGERFELISSLTAGYNCPPDGCNTYRVTYQTLSDFEQDLHRHIHLENNILFLKAMTLEKEITAKP
jgi:regulator of cell morphogenesis and NO signaling